MKTHLTNHSMTLPTTEDLWLESVNGDSNIRVYDDLLARSITNILKTKDESSSTKPILHANFLLFWRIPKGTTKNLVHFDPLEELIQCAIETSKRVIVEVRMTGPDNISRLYRVGKKLTNDADTQQRVQWREDQVIEAYSNEIMNTDDVIAICELFMKREAQRIPEGFYLHELTEFAAPVPTNKR